MSSSAIFTNAKIVLREEIVSGTLVVKDGIIEAIETGETNAERPIDCDGCYLLPGFVELHTDNLEKHFSPRPKVDWPAIPAALAHDAQLTAGGITTVFDAICLGDLFPNSPRVRQLEMMSDAISHSQMQNLLRAEHKIHLRCELSFDGVVELFDKHVDHPLVGLVSLMDHTPGQRQFVDLETYSVYYKKKYGFNDLELEAFAEKQREAHDKFSDINRAALVKKSRARNLPVASHDDATPAHVEESIGFGAVISEFPTTLEAARSAKSSGLNVLMGAPNLVLGGSHSGNVSAKSLASEGLLDILSSDYVPSSLIQGVFLLADGDEKCLPAAVQKASANPAKATGLEDRGELKIGKRADLIKVSVSENTPIVESVWRQGVRVI